MSTGRYFISILVIVCASASVCFGVQQKLKSVALSGGREHALIVVVTDNNEVFSAGNTDYGRLGRDGTNTVFERVLDGEMGTTTDLLENISGVAAGGYHSLMLDKTTNKRVWATGYNPYGQLGDGTTTDRSAPVQVHAGEQNSANQSSPLQNIVDIAASNGGQHSLAVDSGGTCYSFGFNLMGQLGIGSYDNNPHNTPKKVRDTAGTGYLANIAVVSAGLDFSIARTRDSAGGNVYTWGSNSASAGDGGTSKGKLGIGNTDLVNVTTPQKVLKPLDVRAGTYLGNIVAISAGWNHGMALEKYVSGQQANKGRVFCWGYNSSGFHDDYLGVDLYGGRLGDGTTTSRSVPISVKRGEQTGSDPNLLGIVAIAAGESHSMARDANGNVLTWGDNTYGQLGRTSLTSSTTPVYVKLADGHKLSKITKIAAGAWACYAVDSDGVLWVWGKVSAGRLGLGNIGDNQFTPVPIQLTYPGVHNTTVSPYKNYYTINEAVSDAASGDTLVVDEGRYYEHISSTTGKNLTIKGSEPDNPAVTANTVINSHNNIAFVFYDADLTLDGLTISGERLTGESVHIENSNSHVQRCRISSDSATCIVVNYGNTEINDCVIDGGRTNSYGIGYSGGDEHGLGRGCMTVNNCKIKDCNNGGIHAQYLISLMAYNNVISGANGLDSDFGYGIYLDAPEYTADPPSQIYGNIIYGNKNGVRVNGGHNSSLHGNTIVGNTGYGIYFDDSGDATSVSNSILWNNGTQISTSGKSNVTYCDVQGGFAGVTNFNSDPTFVKANAEDFHLKFGSPCIDTGDPDTSPLTGETDIDGEGRILDGNADGTARADIGADEYRGGDFNNDGAINLRDYSMFASAWLQTLPGSIYDLNGDNSINYSDLDIFAANWLSTRAGEFIVALEQQKSQMEELGAALTETTTESQQGGQMMDLETQAATISLFYDGNEPNEDDEVTVYVRTDAPLDIMEIYATVDGYATITAAMTYDDCNQYGWGNSFPLDTYIDELNGMVYFGGVAWPQEANGVVGYFKFIYHGGEVAVFINDIGGTSTPDFGLVEFSTDQLIFGRDPNDP